MKMNKYIAYCGLDCETCNARIATINNDEELRKKVAAEWSKLNGVEITPAMINLPHRRNKNPILRVNVSLCAMEKQMETCGSCPEIEKCKKVEMVIGNNKEAHNRLK